MLALESCSSTNDEARRLAREGAPDGSVIWARRQTAGRGRWGRKWESPRGNLYCSVIVEPAKADTEALLLGFAAGLAVADTLAELMPRRRGDVALKWPNDILVDGRKIAGILVESETAERGLAWLVIGIGINVARPPEDARWPAVALTQIGVRRSLETVLEGLLRWFDYWRGRMDNEGFGALRDAWHARAYGLGQQVTIGQGEETVTGRLIGLNAGGGLRLETEQGEMAISYGDIFAPEEG